MWMFQFLCGVMAGVSIGDLRGSKLLLYSQCVIGLTMCLILLTVVFEGLNTRRAVKIALGISFFAVFATIIFTSICGHFRCPF